MHKFYNRGEQGLPSKVSAKLYERLQQRFSPAKPMAKAAHRIWNIADQDGELIVERDVIKTGDRVSVLVGGAEVRGRMVAMRIGQIGVDTKDGIEYYPMGWVLKAQANPQQQQPQAQPPPAQPGQAQPAQQAQPQKPKRTTTRNDLTPVQPGELTEQQRAVAEHIYNAVSQRGQVIFQMDPTGADDSDPTLTVTPEGNGFKAVQTAKVQTAVFHNTYPSIEQMVIALQLNQVPQEAGLTKPKPVTKPGPAKVPSATSVTGPKF